MLKSKNIFIVFIAVTLLLHCTVVVAQNYNVQSAYNHLKHEEFAEAKAYIDKAAVHESTVNDPKMWTYRGRIYINLYTDTTYDGSDEYLGFEAMKSFFKCIETDQKERFVKDCKSALTRSALAAYREAVRAYQEKEYDKTIEINNVLLEVYPYDENRVLPRNNVPEEVLYLNNYFAYLGKGDMDKCKENLQTLIDKSYNDPNIYIYMSTILLKENDTTKALEYLNRGAEIFYDNADIIKEQIRLYTLLDKTDELLLKVDDAVQANPYDPIMYFQRATLKEEIGDLEGAASDYLEAIELKPDFFDAHYNLGALHYNQASEITKEMNELSYREQEKYDALKAKRDKKFEIALSYFEEAIEINEESLLTLKALSEIYARTEQYDKNKEVKRKLEEIRDKQKERPSQESVQPD